MKQLKHGVVGLGWFGEKHCEAFSSLPQVEIASLCTRTESRLSELGEKFGVAEEKRYTDYKEMFADPDVESVSITTMWDQHVEPTVAALEAGKHVFLEKPMASSVEDCDAIVEAAAKAKGYLLVGHICRFNPRYAAARDAIASGQIGKVVSAYSRRNLPAWVGASVLDKIGPIIGDGVHDTDLMFWMTGSKAVSAYAQTVQVREHANPDLGHVMYRLENGASCLLEVVWCLPDKTPFQIDERLEIVGTEGSISVHDTHPNFMIVDNDGVRCPDTTYWPEVRGQVRGALRDELEYFADCVLHDRKPDMISPEESREAVRACLAAEESARTGEVVKIG